jgi:hypothetical protein
MSTQLTRKEFLDWLGVSAFGGIALANESANQLEQRAAQLIQEYDRQGIHRTGTKADELSAHWLAAHARRLGSKVTLESFTLDRVDPQACFVEASGKRIAGVPIFDASFTDAAGLRGRLGALGSDAEIGWIELPPLAEYSESYEPTRRNNKHKAIIVLSKGTRPGLCLINAPEFSHPYGAPLLQLSSEHGAWLRQQTRVHFVAHVKRTKTQAINVTATIKGTNAKLAPLIVMTPRSGWWHSTSERGGGLVCWLEVMRALAQQRPARDVHFLSSSGHELGHLGLQNFIERHPSLVPNAHAWMHFGANIGAVGALNRIQASSDELEAIAVNALTNIGVTINDKAKRGTVPLGEAGNIHRGGGRYLSLLCPGSTLFHHPADRWPAAVNVPAVVTYATAFAAIARQLTQGSAYPKPS